MSRNKERDSEPTVNLQEYILIEGKPINFTDLSKDNKIMGRSIPYIAVFDPIELKDFGGYRGHGSAILKYRSLETGATIPSFGMTRQINNGPRSYKLADTWGEESFFEETGPIESGVDPLECYRIIKALECFNEISLNESTLLGFYVLDPDPNIERPPMLKSLLSRADPERVVEALNAIPDNLKSMIDMLIEHEVIINRAGIIGEIARGRISRDGEIAKLLDLENITIPKFGKST